MRSRVVFWAVATPLLLSPPALAQSPPVKTKSFTHEWIHIEVISEDTDGPFGVQNFRGKFFLEDVSGNRTRVQMFLRNLTTGELVLDCFGDVHIEPGGEAGTRDWNIIQVGPFAQAETGDLTPIKVWTDSACLVPPDSLTLDCPFQGKPITTAPEHVTFNHTGTYRSNGPQQPTSYTLKGHQDTAVCTVVLNGVEYFGLGFLTNIKDTRRGSVDDPTIFWKIPNAPNPWLSLADLIEVYRQIAPPGQ